jgi:3,4-dihydroxyphenylacetate 2,3-dioxygenase
MAHDATTLAPEYGTLVPMRYMNQDQHFKVVSVSALCTSHYLADSARLGWAMRKAVEDHYDGTVAFLASGSLSHRFAQNGQAPDFATKVWSPFLETLDHRVVQMWQDGEWEAFCGMLPEYAAKGHGEGFMHDTAMLLGALGWSDYDGKAEVVTPYFGSSGTGQINDLPGYPAGWQRHPGSPGRQPGSRGVHQPPVIHLLAPGRPGGGGRGSPRIPFMPHLVLSTPPTWKPMPTSRPMPRLGRHHARTARW